MCVLRDISDVMRLIGVLQFIELSLKQVYNYSCLELYLKEKVSTIPLVLTNPFITPCYLISKETFTN